MTDLKAFSLSNVTLKDDYLINAFQKEVTYLLSFDTDRLLAGFRENAGLDTKGVQRYSGWENMLIGGHTLGHYLTAVAQAYESATVSSEDALLLLEKMEALLDGLKECQDAYGTGLIFGATLLPGETNSEKQFANVIEGKTNLITESWVPWYTMHKIVTGLVAVANLNKESYAKASFAEGEKDRIAALSKLALDVVSYLGDWVYKNTSSWDEETHKKVLSVEYGGMNDCMYEVYKLTAKEEHLQAAHAFDEITLFEKIKNASVGDNVLNNHHANTNIPKFAGALNRYTVTKEKEYLEYVEKFWDLVVNNHSYITGGNSEWEHFGEDNVLDKERTNCNCETCNAYNMLRITKLLFMITGKGKYADWYENTFINSILASQNPATGMTTYFVPMASGFFKTYSEPHTKFWCCTGSGMENFSKLGESFFFHNDTDLVINQYFSSTVSFNGTLFELSTAVPASDSATLKIQNDFNGNLIFRLPDWICEKETVLTNGKPATYEIVNTDASVHAANCLNETKVNGYAVVKGPFKAGTTVEIKLHADIKAYNLPDNANSLAFKYGPLVLTALLGQKDMVTTSTGVDVTIAKEKDIPDTCVKGEEILFPSGSKEDFIANLNSIFEVNSQKLTFKLSGPNCSLTYVPHYSQHTQRYALYLPFT